MPGRPSEVVVRTLQAHVRRSAEDRQGFYARGAWPFHVAFEDSYVRENWGGINVMCRFNGIP